MRRGAVIGLVFCCLAALVAAPAGAATPRILKPRAGAILVRPDGKLRVVVGEKARPRLKIDGRKIGAHLERAGEAWKAVLPLTRFGVGDHILTASTGDATTTRRFYVATRSKKAVKFFWHTSWNRRGSHLLGVRTSADISNAGGYPKVFLNGRSVSRRMSYDEDDRGFGGGVGADSGLRYGRNRMRVEVLLTNGKFASASRTFKVGRGRPLAGAGPDRRVAVGKPVTLDGGSTRLPLALIPASAEASAAGSEPAPEPLEYNWQVIAAPNGPPAVLKEPESEAPTLIPKVPGSYEIELVARPEGNGPAALDVTTVHVPQTNEPIGVPIQTITDSGAVQVGREVFPRKQAGVKMVVLSAGELTPVAGEWGAAEETFVPQGNGEFVATFEEGGSKKTISLLKAVEEVGKQQVVILTGQGESLGGGVGASGTSSPKSMLVEAITKLGGSVTSGQTPDGAPDLAGGEWSVIGYKGLTEGHAQQDISLQEAPIPNAYSTAEFPDMPKDGGSPGSLNGFMQRLGSTYGYVSPEFLSLDTKWTSSPGEAPSNTQNTIAVGSEHYASATIPEGAVAIQLLVLDGSDPTKVLENQTYTVLNPPVNGKCSIATEPGPGQIEALDAALGHWATESTQAGAPRESNLVIAQDFGHQETACFPGSASTAWLQDVLPSITKNGGNWVGSSWPTERTDLLTMWNSANGHGHGSVAGNFGRFAGTVAHDAVANYHRPFYEGEHKRTVNRSFGGLTLVASTNLYQPSSAFFQGQGEQGAAAYAKDPAVANGRVTGVLRRNEQAQWALESATGLAGLADEKGTVVPLEQAGALELIFSAPTPRPCSVEHPAPCDGSKAEIAAAQRYFAFLANEKSTAASVRDLYVSQFGGDNFSENPFRGTYPSKNEQIRFGGGEFSPSVYTVMREGAAQESPQTWRGLEGELADWNKVNEGVKLWRGFFEKDNASRVDIAGAGQQVIEAVQKTYRRLERENKEAKISGAVGADSLYFLEDMVEIAVEDSEPEAIPISAPALGALASMIDLGEDSADLFGEEGEKNGEGNVANDTEAIRARLLSLGTDTAARYELIEEAMSHFGTIFVADPVKLHEAASNFKPGGDWNLPAEAQRVLKLSLAGAAQIDTFETVMPLAFTQWVTSPRYVGGFKEATSNPQGPLELPALNYICEDATKNPESGKTRNPWANKPETLWAMESVAWTGGGPTKGTNFAAPENSQPFTIRVLKSSADNMVPDRDEEAEIPGLKHSGETAPSSLLERLFSAPDPRAKAIGPKSDLGASKEEIFGADGWETKKFGCGEPIEEESGR